MTNRFGANKLKTYGRWAFVEFNEDHFTGGLFADDETEFNNCREAYAETAENLRS